MKKDDLTILPTESEGGYYFKNEGENPLTVNGILLEPRESVLVDNKTGVTKRYEKSNSRKIRESLIYAFIGLLVGTILSLLLVKWLQ